MKDIADIEQRVYDASCINDYLCCPRLFYYRWVRKLLPIVEPPALLFGRVMHEALLVWYKTKDVNEAVKVFQQLPSDIADDRRTKEHGEVILKEYVKRYATEPYQIRQMEIEFCIDMGEGRMYAGRIDQIVEWEKQLFIKDHKTTSSLGLSFYRSFRPSVQIDGYIYACRELCGQCSGAIINGISIANNPKERFGRSVSTRTPQEVDRFYEMFHCWCEMIEAAVLQKKFPMYYTQCNHWGQCVFWELCVYGEDSRTLAIFFKEKEVKNERV